MIGSVDPLRRPVLDLLIRGPFGSQQIRAVLDTGFSSDLESCLVGAGLLDGRVLEIDFGAARRVEVR